MSNPLRMWNSWYALNFQAAQLAWEAQGVIALRLMRLAQGGARGQAEAQRMVTEKAATMVEAQGAAASAALMGGNSARVAKKAVSVYRKRVRSNRRRLSK